MNNKVTQHGSDAVQHPQTVAQTGTTGAGAGAGTKTVTGRTEEGAGTVKRTGTGVGTGVGTGAGIEIVIAGAGSATGQTGSERGRRGEALVGMPSDHLSLHIQPTNHSFFHQRKKSIPLFPFIA